ncbi:hypothetical protein PYW08_002263 [Mythimna loreyi]|uniref:Uncharacterized protein n=1 Tax=Mythimna loreyi TaxID=667449 RepID=A0ACC2R282_9NEOP|nr:hypothetical protein PYW08_002263 [Mythimna loreyi]
MSIVLKTGFVSVTHNIKFQPQTVFKGKLLVLAGHVRDVEELRTKQGQSSIIHALIIRQTSITLPPYKTVLNVNTARVVTSVKCNCVYNQSGKCKHIAALIHFINHEESLSKTCHEQQWGKPSARQFAKQKYSKGRYFDEMFPTKQKISYEPMTIDLSDLAEHSALRSVMEASSQTEDTFIIKDVVETIIKHTESNLVREDCEASVISFLIFKDEFEVYQAEYKLEEQLQQFYEKNIQINEETLINVCCKTIEQSKCEDWYANRHLRISASTNVHHIKVQKTKTTESLVSSFLHPRKIECEATKYGLRNEQHALHEYEKLHSCKVKKVGLIISKYQPWLCASIDGVVIENDCILSRLVEIKCPLSCSKQPVINYNEKMCNVKYLEFVNDRLELKTQKPYYTQIQVQMYVTGMTVCDLFVYSPVKHGSCTVRVHRDEAFIKHVILVSERFYFEHYLKSLYLESTCENDSNNNKTEQPKRNFTGKNIINVM